MKIGTAVKFADGTMICTKLIRAGIIPIKAASGNIFISDPYQLGRYVETFIEDPVINVTLANSWLGWVAHIENSGKSNAGQIQIGNSYSHNSTSYNIYVIAVGKWK